MTDASEEDPDLPLHVALAIESSGPGGAENVVLRLGEALSRRGDRVTIVTMRPGWMTERAEAAGLPVWLAPQRQGLDPAWIPRFAWRLRRAGVQILHSHEFAMNVYGGVSAMLAGLRSVATIHGRAWVTAAPRRALAYRTLRRLGMPIVAVSHDLAGYLCDGLAMAPDRLTIVHNGIPVSLERPIPPPPADRSAHRSALGLPVEAPLILAVGNLYPVKDHATLIRAAARLERAHVAIAGRGDEEVPLRRLADELGIADRVHLLGLRDDVPALMRTADVFVQPSKSEGLPLAVLEAMALGLVVVASDVGGIREAVVDGETGWMVPPASPQRLAEALARALDDPERAIGMGTRGWTRVVDQFSIEAMADRYRALYRGARASRSPISRSTSS